MERPGPLICWGEGSRRTSATGLESCHIPQTATADISQPTQRLNDFEAGRYPKCKATVCCAAHKCHHMSSIAAITGSAVP